MFTFSFSYAFEAVPTTGTNSTLDTQYAAKQTELLTTKNAVIEKLATSYDETVANVGTITIPKSVYTQIAEKIYKEYMDVLAIAYSKKDLTATVGTTDGAARNNMAYADVATVSDYLTLVTCADANKTYLYDVLRANFENYKNDAKTEVNKIDTSLYSDDVMIKADPYQKTYKQYADEVKSDMTADIEKVTLASDASNSETDAAYKAVYDVTNGKLAEQTGYTDTTTNKRVVVTYKSQNVSYTAKNTTKTLLTKDQLGIGDSQDAATIASKKAQIAAHAAYYYNCYVTNRDATTAAGKEEIAAAKKLADAYVEVMNCRIENDPSAVVNTTNPDGTINVGDNGHSWIDVKKMYDDLADYAATCKVMVDATGKLVFDAAKIDKNLAKAKVEVYDGDTDYSSRDAVTNNAYAKNEDLAWAQEVKIAALEDARDDLLYKADKTDNYYDLEKAKITARYDEVIAKVKAATTVAQVDTISTSVTTSDIKNKGAVENYIKGLSKFATEKGKLDSYAAYVTGTTKSWEDGYKAPLTADELAKFYAKNNASTNPEIEALTETAKAQYDSAKTNKEAKEAKKAVEDQVAALPGYITIADKDAVTAAWKAADDLDATIDNQAKLNNSVAQLKNAELKAINDAIDALPALDKVTVANKDAVKALVDAKDAYEANPMYKESGNFATYAKADTVKAYKNAVREAARKDVEATIAALPDNATSAQVAAARKAYDAFVEEYQNAHVPYDAKNMIINLEKLTYFEAQAAAQIIKDVQSLKITAGSTAKKGSITVKWTVKGNVAAADGFQVWKSTKKNSGFKKAITTTKQTYKNTKGLKKGTRYYYKVRAYKVVDGKNVYSDWSNKAIRKAK